MIVGFSFFALTSGSASKEALQSSPLEVLRTARMRVEALKVRSWRADSRPRPALAPVTMMVLPLRSMPVGRGVTLGWKKTPMVCVLGLAI